MADLRTVAAVRALEEAEGLCERCEERRLGAVTAVERPTGSGRFAVRCIDPVACGRRVRDWALAVDRGDA